MINWQSQGTLKKEQLLIKCFMMPVSWILEFIDMSYCKNQIYWKTPYVEINMSLVEIYPRPYKKASIREMGLP
jgi:hypothetical protein